MGGKKRLLSVIDASGSRKCVMVNGHRAKKWSVIEDRDVLEFPMCEDRRSYRDDDDSHRLLIQVRYPSALSGTMQAPAIQPAVQQPIFNASPWKGPPGGQQRIVRKTGRTATITGPGGASAAPPPVAGGKRKISSVFEIYGNPAPALRNDSFPTTPPHNMPRASMGALPPVPKFEYPQPRQVCISIILSSFALFLLVLD